MSTKVIKTSLLTLGVFLLAGFANAADIHGQGGVNANRYAPDYSRHSYVPQYSTPVRFGPVLWPLRPMMMPSASQVVPTTPATPVVVQQLQPTVVSQSDSK